MSEPVVPQISGTILNHFKEPLWESEKRFICLQGGAGSGKAVPGYTKVITPDGYKLMRDIRIGDVICDGNGGTTIVSDKYHPPVTQMYELEFADGRKCVACEDHLWSISVATNKYHPKDRISSSREIYTLFQEGYEISIPLAKPVYHSIKELPIPPYQFGLSIDIDSMGIPDDYLYSFADDRYELLKGILDANGYDEGDGFAIYYIEYSKLADDIAQLVRSLGGTATISLRRSNDLVDYEIKIRFGDEDLALKSIKPIDYNGDIFCIKVDSPDRLYLIEDYILTHNSHAICQRVCYRFLTEENIIIAVVRASMPILKKSVYLGDPSIVRQLADWGIPVNKWLNKSDNKIINPQNRSEVWFIGLDSAEKIKSQNVNLIFIEEATELTLEKWSQLNTRLRRPHAPDHPNQMYIAYNPISVFNWVIQLFVVNPSKYIADNTYVHFSNFTQNPYVSKDDVAGWLDTASRDENYYWTYVVGKPGIPLGQIYPGMIFSPRNGVKDEETGEYVVEPWDPEVWRQEPYYGIDWGYVDPTVIVECREYKGTIYVINRFYKKEQTMKQIIEAMKRIGITSSNMIYCDSAEADRINDLSLAGFCPNKANKNKHAGITWLKGQRVVIDSTGENGEIARSEINSYSWAKDPDDPRIFLDEPEENQQDHFCLTGDTLITTNKGDIPIKDIKVGDSVLTRKGYRKVIDWAKTGINKETMTVSVGGHTIRCTPNHKIWVENKKDYILADELCYDDYLLVLNQSQNRVLLKRDGKREDVYNITVEGEHEYFANGILVSNCDAMYYATHTHHLKNCEFSVGTLDMSPGQKASDEILKEMKDLVVSFK